MKNSGTKVTKIMKIIFKILILFSTSIIFYSQSYADQASISNFYSISSGKIKIDDRDFNGNSNLVSINSGVNFTRNFAIEMSFLHFDEIRYHVRTYEEPLIFSQNLTILHAYGLILTPVLTQSITKYLSISGKIGMSVLYVNRKRFDGITTDDAIDYNRHLDIFYSAGIQGILSDNFSLGVSISRLKVGEYDGDIISGTIKFTY